MRIKYVSWNYGRSADYPYPLLHLVRLSDGRGLLRTTRQCQALGLCK